MAVESSVTDDLTMYLKCCPDTQNKVLLCIKCGAVYHKSCAKKKNLEYIEGAKVKCCGNDGESEVTSDCPIILENQMLKKEVSLLNKLIKEMCDKNAILKENA